MPLPASAARPGPARSRRHARRRRARLAAGLLAVALAVVAALLVTALVGRTDVHGRFGMPFDRDPESVVARAVRAQHDLPAASRALLGRITAQPTATWVTAAAATAEQQMRATVTGAARRHAVPVVVLYRIPHRDCGSYSASKEPITGADYRGWVSGVVGALGTRRAIVVIEPDALAQLDCLSRAQRIERIALIRDAVEAVRGQGSWAYVDAGHAGWISDAAMADSLRRVGVGGEVGFALNVSSFGTTADQIAYGERLSESVGGAHFVIDTSRNGGAVGKGLWCNPAGAKLGPVPTVRTAAPLVDAYLWIKTPGLSDGTCDGGPAAGAFWPRYALGLAGSGTTKG